VAESRISTKGQVVIPKRIRSSLGLRAGDRVEFTIHDRHAHLAKKNADVVEAFLGGPKGRWRKGELEKLLKERER